MIFMNHRLSGFLNSGEVQNWSDPPIPFIPMQILDSHMSVREYGGHLSKKYLLPLNRVFIFPSPVSLPAKTLTNPGIGSHSSITTINSTENSAPLWPSLFGSRLYPVKNSNFKFQNLVILEHAFQKCSKFRDSQICET